MKKEVVLMSDIIKKVSKTIGVEEKIVQSLISNNIDYIKFLATKTDNLSIRIPYVGTLYFNAWDYSIDKRIKLKKIQDNKHISTEDLNRFHQAEKKYKAVSEYEDMLRKTGLLKHEYAKTKHKKRRLLTVRFHNGGCKTLTELEDKQNEYAEE